VRRLEALKPERDDLLGESRLTVTRFEGGESPNQVPEEARITLDRRPVPPETESDFVALVEETLRGVDCDYEVVLPEGPSPESAAFRTDENDEEVQRLRRCVEQTAGSTELRPFGAACEASYIAPHSPVVVFGPGEIDDGEPVAHSEREYVRVEEVRAAADALTRFLNG
ncbi:MAG: M20/M25/M40 family metallo-hydrolase, partial [Halobacteriales archaeon]